MFGVEFDGFFSVENFVGFECFWLKFEILILGIFVLDHFFGLSLKILKE